MEGTEYECLIYNAIEVAKICEQGEELKVKEQTNDVCLIKNGAIVINNEGLIHDVGSTEEILQKYANSTFKQKIDAKQYCIIPGLVDGHTHPVWSGDRCHEFIMKLEGKSYMDIHKVGGGIGFTVEHTKKSSEEELLALLEDRLKVMLRHGTTLVEAKSGYGLEAETEVKMLKVLKQAKSKQPIEIVSNFCGAHSIPKGLGEQEATKNVIEVQIPAIKEAIAKNEIDPELIDVFCEKGVFERETTKQILLAGKEIGLLANFHGDEINFIDSGTLGGEVGALAISHLENLDDNGIKAMAEKKILGVLLPTTQFLLKLKVPPVRQMIEQGVPVALGTDFNPNAYCLSMPLTMHLSCVNYKMTPNEALVASTINSAASMRRSKTHGSIEKGKVADLVLIKGNRWEHIIYQMGESPIKFVIKRGKIVFENQYI